MVNVHEWILKEKIPIIFSVLVLVVVSIGYFGVSGLGLQNAEMNEPVSDPAVYDAIQLKVGFSPAGDAKVFALAKSNALSKYSVFEGNPLPEKGSMVLGELEADMMKSEKLFLKAGDSLDGFFGLTISVEGILMKTNGPADYFHFLSPVEFEKISGDSNRLFILMDGETAKVFYRLDRNAGLPGFAKLAEGTFTDFSPHEIAGVAYYPVVLGASESELMRSDSA